MILFDGLDNLNRPAKYWALSDYMIVYLILLPIFFGLVVLSLPVLLLGLITGVWEDDYDN